MILRRSFLSLVLLAPLAKLVGREAPIDLSKVKLTKIMGTMEITPEAMEKIWLLGGRGGGKTEMQRHLNREMSKTLEHHRLEMDRIYGHHTAARGIQISALGR
jgi:hypothetical protein